MILAKVLLILTSINRYRYSLTIYGEGEVKKLRHIMVMTRKSVTNGQKNASVVQDKRRNKGEKKLKGRERSVVYA